MISDLSPWDKLSLKGKIFELQKKLSIIDIQTRREEEFSYRPALISNYRLLSGRDGNILDNIQKAEVIRRQRKDDLRAQIMQQDQEDCTFSPAINSSARTHSTNDKRPFYVRLAEKGRRYSESLEKKRAQCRSYDDDGKKMFIPTIIKKDAAVTKDGLPTNKAHGDGSSTADQRSITSTTAAADEFLYLDAFDREERARRKHRQAEEEAEVLANTRKMNSSSLVLLRRRAEKTSQGLFAVLDAEGVGSVGYDDIERYAKKAFIAASSYGDCESSSIASDVWSVLDPLQTGVATLAAFMRIATPIITADRSTPLERMLTSEGVRPTPKQVESCRAFVKSLASLSEKTAVDPAAAAKQEAPYSPPMTTVSKVTQKLARRREEKDKTRLREILVNTAASSVASGLSDDPSSVRFDDDDLPPPPPPSLSKYSSDGDDDLNLSLISHHELMYARGLIQQERQKQTVQRVTAATMQDCTFQPRIRPRSSSSSSNNASTAGGGGGGGGGAVTPVAATGGDCDLNSRSTAVKQDHRVATTEQSKHKSGAVASGHKASASAWKNSSSEGSSSSAKIFDRLYSKKVKSQYQKSVEPTAHMVQEMKACTFAPRMSQAFAHSTRHRLVPAGDRSNAVVSSPPNRDAEAIGVVSVPGFERAVRRLVVSRSEKQRKLELESDDRQREELEQRYVRSRELARQGVQPFKFSLQARRDGKDYGVQQQKRSDPDLIVDIKLSSTKSAKIPLWRGDDPSTIASSFGLIYSLDAVAQQLLIDVLLRSMQDHGLDPPPREAVLGSEAAVDVAVAAGVPSTHISATSVRESMITSLIHEVQDDASDASETPDEEFSDYGSSGDDFSLQTKSIDEPGVADGIVEAETEVDS